MDFVIINSYNNYVDAHIARGVLEEEGINCWLKDEHTVTIDPILTNAVGGIKIMVHKDQAERAWDILTTLIKEQQAKVAGAYEIASEIRLLEDRRNQLIHDSADVAYQRFSSIKHALGTPLMNLSRGLKNIEAALDRTYNDWRTTKTSEFRDISLDDTFRSLHNILKDVHNLLHVNDQFLNFKAYTFEEFDFVEFIQTYIRDQEASLPRNISIHLELGADIIDDLKECVIIKGNKNLLKIALDNILSNARVHAFGNEETVEYKILFVIDLYIGYSLVDRPDNGLNISLQILNTGKAFPLNFDLEKFKRAGSRAGETANTGQGGYQIDEIIKFHNYGNSTLELDTTCEGSEYTTAVSFSIPMSK